MNIVEAAMIAREKAATSTDRADHIISHCLDAAVDAEARLLLAEEADPDDWFEPPPVSHILIPRPGTDN